MNKTIVIPSKFLDSYQKEREKCNIFVFSSFCGMGKTAIVQELLKNKKISNYSVEKKSFTSIDKNTTIFLIDNAQRIQNEEQQQELVQFIKENHEKQFFILTRCDLPHWLLSLQIEDRVKVFYETDMRLNSKEVRELFSVFPLNDDEIIEIHDETEGYSLYLNMILFHLKDGTAFSETAFIVAKERMYHYITEQVFSQFSAISRHIFLCLALFDDFNMEFIKMVSGEQEIPKILEEIQMESNVLTKKTESTYGISPLFQGYLQWKLTKEYKVEEIRQLYSSAGRYYELNDKISLALACYQNSQEERKIIKVLERNSEKNPALGEYLELEPYYLSLSEEKIKKSPSLMMGMSMVKCMRAGYEESNDWFEELENYLKSIKKSNKEYKSAKSKLIYLEIALPQFRTDSLLSLFTNIFTVVTSKEVNLPRFSITSLLPSILNGGKDFSPWTKDDMTIYKTMRLPCETILGKDGVGAFDCAICESLFEKGQDYIEHLVQAMSKLSEIQQNGTPEIEFYLMGLMARIQVFQGHSQAGKETLLSVKKRFQSLNDHRFHDNIQAMLCKIELYQGNYEKAWQWLEEIAPKNDHQIWTFFRLQYLVKSEVYIQQGNFLQALCLLSQLRNYTIHCNRYIDKIHTNILIAICYYRERNHLWKENLAEAIEIACEFQYIYPVSQYGVAILPLLTEFKAKKEQAHFSKILLATRNQASIYQRYLEPCSRTTIHLSPAEMSVLRLICQNKSNAEIGEILSIKLPTVKVHTSNIFKKMDVSRRSEAKTEALRLNLIDDYLAQ